LWLRYYKAIENLGQKSELFFIPFFFRSTKLKIYNVYYNSSLLLKQTAKPIIIYDV